VFRGLLYTLNAVAIDHEDFGETPWTTEYEEMAFEE
jgi:hypothetical protein